MNKFDGIDKSLTGCVIGVISMLFGIILGDVLVVIGIALFLVAFVWLCVEMIAEGE